MNRFVLPIETMHGTFLAHYSENGLAGLDFPRADQLITSAAQCPEQVLEWHKAVGNALKAVLEGQAVLELPPLDVEGTEFQQSVWNVMRTLGPGQTISYGALAAKLGKPGASRAVGAACGANPIPVLIPCHRVLAANGKLGGFSGGLDWKRKLLVVEGITFL